MNATHPTAHLEELVGNAEFACDNDRPMRSIRALAMKAQRLALKHNLDLPAWVANFDGTDGRGGKAPIAAKRSSGWRWSRS